VLKQQVLLWQLPAILDKDESGIEVNQTMFRGMIGSLLYLTASRPDIMQSVCVCARYQANPKESHLIAVKRILKYLKGTISFGLWYPSGASLSLIGYSDADYGGCKIDRKSTRNLISFLALQKTSLCGFVNYRGRIHCYWQLLCPNPMDEATIRGLQYLSKSYTFKM